MGSTDRTEPLPPHDLEAERAVLGAVFRDPTVLPDVEAVLRPESFYFDANAAVFRAMVSLAADDRPVDPVAVRARLQAAGALENCGGTAYLADLLDAVPTAANVGHHAHLVREAAMLRGAIHTARELISDAHHPTGPAEDVLGRAERSLSDLATAGTDVELVAASQLVREFLQAVDDRAARGGPDGLTTGFVDVDELLSGLKPGQLAVVGARPGCGKTAFGLAVATATSAAGVGVLFASLEMSRAELMDRVAAMRSGVPLRTIQHGALTPEQAGVVHDACSAVGREPLVIVADDLSAARLTALTRRCVRRHRVGLVVVDYLQLLRPENPKDPRHLQVGTLARRMKQLARACGVPVLLLAQLNREVEGRPGGKPRLADLRESGEIEAHADTVLLLHPQPDQDAGAAVWNTDVVVAKNRNGPTGEVTLGYRRRVVRFENAARGLARAA